jgi:excisionase family DNA binding protein
MKDIQLLTKREAAARLGVSVDTVGRLVHRGELSVITIGRCVRIPADGLARLVERGRAGTVIASGKRLDDESAVT